MIGLVLGKLAGVGGAIRAGVRTRVGALPAGVTPGEVWGAAALAGIGFTVSLFIASLAYDAPELQTQAKVGIFAGSIVSGLLGAGVLVWSAARRSSLGASAGRRLSGAGTGPRPVPRL